VKRIVSFLSKEFYIPKLEKLGKVVESFSLTEKLIFGILSLLFIITSLSLLLKVNAQFLVEIPRFGGTLKEGMVGNPRFINPILAISETDRDLTTLVYSGLMRTTPNGNIIPDLAESFEVSDDGLLYTFTIRDDAYFQDGEKVTTDDVIFTILKTQDPAIKSPKRANWDGILIEKIDDRKIRFTLSQPYSPFLLNTTIGILPEHIWKDVSTDEFAFTNFNTNPIGSGPYTVQKIKRNSSGIATYYELKAFDEFTLGKPFIKTIEARFYKNEDELIEALEEKNIDAIHGISPEKTRVLEEENFRVQRLPLPRVFGVFFNSNQAPVLIDRDVRNALDTAVPKAEIIDTVLHGYAQETDSPIPPSLIPYDVIAPPSDTESVDDVSASTEEAVSNTEKSAQILKSAGFEINENGFMERETSDGVQTLSFSISTANVPELVHVAEMVVDAWRGIGADVTLKVFESNDLNQNVIRPRKYDALLFGEIIGRDLDFYAFWHSSQRNDPGLNIANYVNSDVDELLSTARETSDSDERLNSYREFEKEIIADKPASFIYSPDFIYIIPKKLNGQIADNIITPSERFMNVYTWYLETDTVWRVFE